MYNFLNALELCTKSSNWYGALFISLTLPDICAKIEYPLEKKSSSKRYIDWYDKYLKKYYEVSRNAIPLPAHLERLTALVPPHIGGGRKKECFLSGADFYALRCAYLHEGSDEITTQRKREALEKFQFVQPGNNNVFHNNLKNGIILQIQVSELAREVTEAVLNWLEDIKHDNEKINKISNLAEIDFSNNMMF